MAQNVAKRVPPFGRELSEARRQGLAPILPANYFLLLLGWNLHREIPDQKRFPRLVLPLDEPLEDFDLSALIGLDVRVLYHRQDASLVPGLVDALTALPARTLIVGPFPVLGGDQVYLPDNPGETLLAS